MDLPSPSLSGISKSNLPHSSRLSSLKPATTANSPRWRSTSADLFIEKQKRFFSYSFANTICYSTFDESRQEITMPKGKQFLTIIGGIKLMSKTFVSGKMYELVLRMKVNFEVACVTKEPSSTFNFSLSTLIGISADQFWPYSVSRISAISLFVAISSSSKMRLFEVVLLLLAPIPLFETLCRMTSSIILIYSLKSSNLFERGMLSPDSRYFISWNPFCLKNTR